MGYVQKDIRKRTKNFGQHLFEVYRNNLLGLYEIIKKLWTIIDSPKTNNKEKIKAIILVLECYKGRLDLIMSEPSLIGQKRYMDEVKSLRF
jgi:hypothetical protein